MGATSSAGEGGSNVTYERVPAGNYPGRCIQVVELGTHMEPGFQGAEEKPKKKLMIIWELSEYMQDGRPFTVHIELTNSLGEKANLRKLLKSWRGIDFTEAELRRFELKNILDKCCLVNVGLKTSKQGKEYNNVISVSPLPRGMKCDDRVNELVDFGIGDIHTPEFDKLWGWIQKKVLESDEGKASGRIYEPKGTQNPDPPPSDGQGEPQLENPEDQLPF